MKAGMVGSRSIHLLCFFPVGTKPDKGQHFFECTARQGAEIPSHKELFSYKIF